MTNEVKPMKITNHEKTKYERNIFGDQGNRERNFWEEGNSVKVNFGEHLNLFLRNKGTTVNFHREQGNMQPPPPPLPLGGPQKRKLDSGSKRSAFYGKRQVMITMQL